MTARNGASRCVLLCVCLGCAATPRSVENEAHVDPAPLAWSPETHLARCRFTGTDLVVSPQLAGHVVRVASDEVAMVLPDELPRAPYLKAGRAGGFLQELQHDWAEAHQLVSNDRPREATITTLEAQAVTVTADYTVRDGGGTERRYRFEYLRIARNHASCRAMALQELAPGAEPFRLGPLEQVRDTPGLDLYDRPPAKPSEDLAWGLLRGVLYVGARVVLHD